MADSCRLAFFVFILCAGNIIFTAQGMKFAKNKNVIVLTAGCRKGIIGKINVDEKSSGISYSMKGDKLGLLHIDKDSGKVELMKTLDSTITKQLNKKEVTIEAVKSATRQRAETRIIIVVLLLHYGDQFIDKVGKIEVSSKHAERMKPSPFSLLHFLRRPTARANEIGMAELKWEMKITKIKKMILDIVAKEIGGVDIQAYLHIKELFSEKAMIKMEKESLCHERNPVKHCNRRARFRTFDGTCNNLYKPTLGAADTEFIRLVPAKYFDTDNLNDPIGYPNQPNAPIVPSPHVVSNNFITDEIAKASSPTLTHAVMQFGQFIDHDLDLAVEVETKVNECEEVPCDGSDADFVCPCYPILPAGNANCIRVTRSAAVCREDGYPKQREQINVNTAYIDASQVYGSDEELARRLRDSDNSALLKSSRGRDGELLPPDTEIREGLLGLCEDFGGCFLAGDTRSNEQTSLAAFHTLFLREHNRIARVLQRLNGRWSNTKVYLETRRILAAVMQKITYKDFLPKIVGNRLKRYRRYNPKVDAGISNVFATAVFRFGHSLIRPKFDVVDNGFNPIGDPIDLRFMFFNNTFIQRNGITPLLLGLTANSSENVDRILSPGITRHLFERSNRPGSNLAALNIQRSRDHGLPGYNTFRVFSKLGIANNFQETKNEITNPENRNILRQLYDDNPSNLEVWVAGLAETPLPGASVGPIFSSLINDQFERTRDGDRFYFERKGVLRSHRFAQIYRASLSRMYCDNLKDVVSIQRDAFLAPTTRSPRISCERIPGIDLCKWKETKYFTKPCIFGTLATIRGTCKCHCSAQRRSFGPKCDAWRTTRGPVLWHASIFMGKQFVCSGARIGQSHVLTTTSCANRVVHGGFVRFVIKKGRFRYPTKESFSIKAHSQNGPLTLLRTATYNHGAIIKIGLGVAKRQATYVTFPGAPPSYNAARVYVAKETLCRKVLTPFDPRKNACTFPAALPQTRGQGSPLVQYFRGRPFLKALLTDIKSDEDLPGDSFGKYITVTRPEVKSWLKRFIPEINFNVFG